MSIQITNSISSPSLTSYLDFKNLGLFATVDGSDNLNINLIVPAGMAFPSPGSPGIVGFREFSSSSQNGYNSVTITAQTSLQVPNGATLGIQNGIETTFYIYLQYNNGVAQLGISQTLFDETQTVNTTTISNTSGSSTLLYAVAGISNASIRLIGYITITEATAGVWASSPTLTTMAVQSVRNMQPTYQTFTSGSGTYSPTFPNCTRIKVKMVGGGGGGGGGGTSSGDGTSAGASVFDVINAGGGATGTAAGIGGAGGGITGSVYLPLFGSGGTNGGTYSGGGEGGGSFYGSGGGGGATISGNGETSAAYGSGGGGGAGNGTLQSGGGGGGGAYVEFDYPPGSYSWTVGTAGTGGGPGTGGGEGGAGVAGIIIVEEYYN